MEAGFGFENAGGFAQGGCGRRKGVLVQIGADEQVMEKVGAEGDGVMGGVAQGEADVRMAGGGTEKAGVGGVQDLVDQLGGGA